MYINLNEIRLKLQVETVPFKKKRFNIVVCLLAVPIIFLL